MTFICRPLDKFRRIPFNLLKDRLLMSQKLVLVLNCGSSSLKFSILDAVSGEEKLSGLAEAFHLPDARIKWKLHGEKAMRI